MEAIKPRQIINCSAGIVLIDLHQQQRKNNFQTIQISDTEYGATSCQRRTEPAEQQPATSAFPNQMIEQINIALEQKVREFLSLGREMPSETNQKREHIHQLKVMKNEHPAVLPSEQDDIVNSLNYEGIAVIGAVFTFLTVTDCVLALSQTK